MTADQYLQSYATFNVYLMLAEGQLEDLKLKRNAVYTENTSTNDGQPGGSGPSDPTARTVEKLAKYDDEIARLTTEIKIYEGKMQEIKNFASRLNRDEQQVALLRYMNSKQMEWHKIAREIHLSEWQCYRIDHRLKNMPVNCGKNVI